MSEDEQGFAVVKNAKRHNQEANSWEFFRLREFHHSSYTIIIYCCCSIFAYVSLIVDCPPQNLWMILNVLKLEGWGENFIILTSTVFV